VERLSIRSEPQKLLKRGSGDLAADAVAGSPSKELATEKAVSRPLRPGRSSKST